MMLLYRNPHPDRKRSSRPSRRVAGILDCESLVSTGTECTRGRKDSIRRVGLLADAGGFVAIGGTVARR